MPERNNVRRRASGDKPRTHREELILGLAGQFDAHKVEIPNVWATIVSLSDEENLCLQDGAAAILIGYLMSSKETQDAVMTAYARKNWSGYGV